MFKLRYSTILNKPFMNRQDACFTKKIIFCGTGILPVLENPARCEFKKIFIRFVVASFCCFSLLTIGYLTPRKWGNYSQTNCEIPIYISNQGIHTDIIVPVKNEYFNWHQYLRFTEIGRDANSDYQ
jgi:Protein of unknown function (DUF2459)